MNKLLILKISICIGCWSEICPASENTILFPNACVEGKSIIVASVGDVLIHHPLLIQGNKFGFESLWQEAVPYIKSADMAYANLEGPIAAGINEKGHLVNNPRDNQVYTSYPYFNYPPALALALKNSGFDIVSTANNHALDRASIGIDKTTDLLNKIGLAPIGTRSKNAPLPFIFIITKNNIKVAWIACTEHTNDNPDKYHQVLHCYRKKDKALIRSTIEQLKNQVDAIIITPHWGNEYQSQPDAEQISFAHEVLNAGATAVIGSHPHVLQPLQKYITSDGRITFIMYSLGNFISYQGDPKKRATIILLFGLTKTSHGTFINGIRFVPFYMQNRDHSKYLQLEKLNEKTITRSPFNTIFSKVLPMGNALYSGKIITTNPACLITWQP